MGLDINQTSRQHHIIKRTTERLLPSTCQIYRREIQIGEDMTYIDTLGDALTWRGLTDIPCRVDQTRHVRDVELYSQEVIVNELELRVPHDAPLQVNTVVMIKGRPFRVIKMYDVVDFMPVKGAVISEVLFGNAMQTFAVFEIWDNATGLDVTYEAEFEGGEAPYTFIWEFGDGQGAVGQEVSHTYAAAGTYTISVLCTDNTGDFKTLEKEVTVSD